MFPCKQCSEVFITDGSRKTHVRKYHQLEMSITLKDGAKSMLTRNDNGTFTCPASGCLAEFANSSNLHTHYLNCSPQKVSTKMDNHSPNTVAVRVVPFAAQHERESHSGFLQLCL
jgi:hypothetical protein